MAQTEPGTAPPKAGNGRNPNGEPRADFNDVIGGSDGLTAITAADVEEDSTDDVLATHPDLAPIQGGDVSDSPAAQPGTRGEGTGADTGTGGEVGTTRPRQAG